MRLSVVSLIYLIFFMTGVARAAAVGTATMVIGSPELVSGNHSIQLEKGSQILPETQILTGSGDHVHIRFVDGTLLSVRPNTSLSIVAFDGNEDSVKRFQLSLEEGVIRTISGSGLKAHRDRFRLNTPIAAIGIRGTDFTTRSSKDETSVRVHSGEIVLAPLGGACSAEGLGPCLSDAALSLAAGTSELLRIRAGGLPERFRGTINGVEQPPNTTQSSPQHAEDEGAVGESVVASRLNATDLTPFTDRPDLQKFNDTDSDLDEQRGALVWGHWFTKPRGDDWSPAAVDLLDSFDPTVSNGYYGLFRDPSHAGLIQPVRSKIILGLTAADAYLDFEFATTKANVTAGYLLLDFQSRAFLSELSVDTDRLGPVSLSGTGFISPTGIFISRSSSDRMAGAMTTDGLEAGMLFEKRIGGGVVQGVSVWGQ